MGRSTQEVAAATEAFMGVTTKPGNLDRLNKLADRISAFSKSGDFSSAADALSGAMRTGRTQGLAGELGLPMAALESEGVKAALAANDVDALVGSLEKAMAAAGMTEEAMAKMADDPTRKMSRLANTFQNKARDAASGLLGGLAPAFDKLAEWLDSPGAGMFFSLVERAATAAGAAAGWLADGLAALSAFVMDNLTPILVGLGIAAALFGASALVAGAQALLAALMPLAPIMLLGAAFAAIILKLHDMGASFEDIFAAVGQAVGVAAGVIGNLLIGLGDFILGAVNRTANVFVDFANFFANVFESPISSAIRLFEGFADTVLGIVEKVASAIDMVFGSSLAGAVQGWRSGLAGLADKAVERFAPDEDYERKMDRFNMSIKDFGLERISYEESGAAGEAIGRGLGKKLDEFEGLDLDKLFGGAGEKALDPASLLADAFGEGENKPIGGKIDSVGSVGEVKGAKEVSLSDEDVRMLVSLSERRFVNSVNVMTLAPNLKIEVRNESGSEPMNARKLAATLARELEMQAAAHTAASFG
jgi:hypothetical protein